MRRWSASGTAILLMPALTGALAASVARGQPSPAPSTYSAQYSTAAVASDHKLASEAGVEILRAGGNAVDAAVAVSLTLSVVRPESCGIGGGGFMLIRLVNDPRHAPVTIALNYREQCPAGITPGFFVSPDPAENQPRSSTTGGAAVAVPGTILGLCHALDTYGTLDRATVFAPAIRAAEEGFIVDAHMVNAWASAHARLQAAPDAPQLAPSLARNPPTLGQRRQNPAHADALRLIAREGPDAFRSGQIGRAIVAAAAETGGVLTMADLAAFRVEELNPLEIQFRGRTILTMPPPSSGGIVLAETFGILERRPADLDAALADGPSSARFLHLFAEATQHAFADRARWLGDTDPEKTRRLLSRLFDPAYLDARADSIDPARTFPAAHYGTAPQLPDDAGTSHFSVIDAHQGVVACTETINLAFGSLVEVEGYGFILNNQMDDFTTAPGAPNAFGLIQSAANAPAPGRRPLSSMTPMIALDEDARVELTAGASGGPRIITATMQSALNAMLFDMSAGEAVAAPRAHHQWLPRTLGVEPAILNSPAAQSLRDKGHELVPAPEAACQLIRRARDDAGWDAASDPRKGGVPAGYDLRR